MEYLVKFKKYLSQEVTALIAYIMLFITFAIIAPYFFTFRNIINILLYSSVIGVCAAGMTMVLISGAIDISVGSTIALSGMAAGLSIAGGAPVWLGIFLAVFTGLVCGAINGFLIAKMRILPLITTLATMSIFRGTAMLTTNGLSQLIGNPGFRWLGRGYVLNVVPYCVLIMLGIFFITYYVLRFTPFGRKVYSVGGNAETSRLAGINVRLVRFSVFVIAGGLAGLGGAITASQTGTAIPTAGLGAEMDVIGAVVLGGTSLNGGRGNIWGTVLGILILATLQNGLTLMNVMSFWQTIAKGIVLIIAVTLDVMRGGGYE